jgi:hypothetical protein
MTLQDVTWSYRRGELMLQTPEYSSLLVLSIPLTLLDDQVDELPRSVCSVRDDVLANRIRQQINATFRGGWSIRCNWQADKLGISFKVKLRS